MAGLLRRLRSEATAEPFTLELDDGTLVVVERPDVDQLLDFPTGLRPTIEALFGDQAAALLAATAGDDVAVLEALVADLDDHFGISDATRLAWLLDRYGDHIAADLRPSGIDVHDLWRGRLTPRELLNLVDHLPRTSHYQDALAQDDEIQDGTVTPPSGQPTGPPLTEFSPEVEILTAAVDRLGEVANAVIAAAGGKPRPVRPWPRPVTAADRSRARERAEVQRDLEQQLFPSAPPV